VTVTPVELRPGPRADRVEVGPPPGGRAPHPEPDGRRPELLPLEAGQQYRFGFDMGACIGCHSCEVACAEQNGLPPDTVWRRVGEIEGGDHPTTRRFHLSMACNHCLDPTCLSGCPTDAYVKLDNGVVQHRADECIGCQYCTWNCPYSVPAFQPDRRIVTKCDLCQPRLEDGFAPACVAACPTHAITVEKVDVAAWRDEHASADAPELPSADLTLSTTRIALPADVPVETFAASDWNLQPEDPHWPLVWLTLVSQLAVGVSAAVAWSGAGPAGPVGGAGAGSTAERGLAAVLAGAAMAGAIGHLGRPIAAWKAMRNLRRSWLSREVALLSLYGVLAALAVVVPGLAVPAAVAGAAGVVASARLYVVPGRPAWDSSLTVVRFAATAVALGPALTGRTGVAAAGAAASVLATAANDGRLWHGARSERAWRGPVRLALGPFRPWTLARLALTAAGVAAAVTGAAPLVVLALLAGAELIGRWLFYVTVVPLNVPGSFWRGTGEGGRR
jgi:Fe-S-cluster-containing dehydrogenase component/DMSO reductase anchor subunit